jgi:basic amino acid/polyamine antiporter, APA family
MLAPVSTTVPPPPVPAAAAPAAPQLARTLGTADLAFTAIGTVIGSGIFLVPGLVLAESGTNTMLALAVWATGGLLSLFGALTYAELGAMRPEAGGIYVYIRDAFGPLPAFLYGWSAFFVIATGAVATLAVAFSVYLGQLVPMSPATSRVVSVALIAVLAALNVRGTRRSVTLQNYTTVLKLAGLAGLALLLIALGDPRAVASTPAGVAPATVRGFGTAMISVLWAYEGWQYVTCLAGEARNPQRTFPRAITLALVTVVLLYVITNLGYVSAIGPAAVASSQRVAADALTARVGAWASAAVSALILISILSSTNASVLSPSRIYFAMARDGVFFERLSRVSPRFGTPAFAIVAGAAWAMVGAATGSFDQLLTYVVFAAWIFYGLAALSIFVYRRKFPDAPRPFRVPGYPVTPLLFVASATLLVLNTIISQPGRAAIGIIIVLSGVPAYYWWRARRAREPREPREPRLARPAPPSTRDSE